jgi:hypothetical protein
MLGYYLDYARLLFFKSLQFYIDLSFCHTALCSLVIISNVVEYPQKNFRSIDTV